MHAAEAASRERGDKTLTLAVATWNAPAHALYESLGYTPERLTMSKVLPPRERRKEKGEP
jgi:ribosomal protein S18 acetylase RimI-like enzyme